MDRILFLILEMMFRKDSFYAEFISGVLLLILAVQSRPYLLTPKISSAMLITVGVLQLASLMLFRCSKCYATRTLTASAGSFAWTVIASHRFEIITEFNGSSLASLVGALMLALTMMLAAVNTVKIRNKD